MVSYGYVCVKDIETFWSYVERESTLLFRLLSNHGVFYCDRYGAIMKEMLEDLDRHRNDEARRIVWLQLVSPQFESMGIVLVAHFKHLLPLLYYWLHAQDESTQLLVIIHFCSGMKDLMNICC
jgi:hypothetical protein